MDDPRICADLLNEALNGKKNKEETVYNVIVNNSLSQRLKIADEYFNAYNKELYEDMKAKLSGSFREAAIHLFLPPVRFYAKMLKKAFKGISVDDALVFEVLTTFSVEDIEKIGIAYNNETKKDLNKDIEKAFSGPILKDLISLMTVKRRVGEIDKDNCEKLCERLIEAGEANWVNDEELFREAFVEPSPEELVTMFRIYYAKTQKSFFEVVEDKLSAKPKTLLRELLFNNLMPYELYAEKVYLAIKGIGTNTGLLSRILVERAEIDMPQIRDFYVQKYKKTMKDDIIGDTSGMYQKLCLFLAGVEK